MAPSRTAPKILLVDDDRRLCGFLSRFLTAEGYATTAVYDGQGMRRALADTPVDLIILDLKLPDGEDGLSLARRLRAQCDTPVIILSGKNATVDKVVGLEIGADDYVTKPFEPRELLARIRTVLRRADSAPAAATEPGDAEAIEFGGWRLDLERHELRSPEQRTIDLTSQEYQLLRALVQRPGRILSREQMLDIVANRHWSPYDRSIDVLVGKLRRKLGDDSRHARLIKTVRGVGYVFTPPGAGASG